MGGIRLISSAKQMLRKQSFLTTKDKSCDVPRGHVSIYVGDQKQRKRFVVPISCLNHPLFREMLKRAEEEFGFNHPMGGLTIPCKEETFVDFITSSLHSP